MTSLTMMAMVKPTRAIDRSWWRPAKASSSSRFTEVDARRAGEDCRKKAGAGGWGLGAENQKRPPPLLFSPQSPDPSPRSSSFPLPQVRQAPHLPPGLGFLLVVPALGVAHAALGPGVLFVHAQVDPRGPVSP